MKKTTQPSKSVVDSVAAACTKVLRSVKLLADEVPSGVVWQTKDPRKAYKFGTELGHGNYGVVHCVTHIQSGRLYACKIIRKPTTTQERQHVVTEVTALQCVSSHPNVVSLKEVWEDADYIYLIMEACLGGELFDVILQRGHFSERDAAVVFKVILEVVAHCHERGVIHRDLKPENFLLKRQALDPKLPLRPEDVRAVDFGLAVFLQPNQTLKELLGSPYYVAPELLRGNYGYPVDVWSAGVILYILLCGAPPFSGRHEREVFHRVLKQPLDLSSDCWVRVSAGAKDLVAKLLNRDPQKRLTPQQALEHPWLKSAPYADALQSTLVLDRLQAFTHMSKLQGILMNLIAKNLSTEGIDTLRDAFNALDTNGDGYLSFEELRQGLGDASLESEQCGNVAQAVMGALDVTGDGSIDYHEFLAAVVDRQRTLTDQTLAEMFEYLDKNHDGKVSVQELSDALAESDIVISPATLRQLMVETPGFQPSDDSEPMLTEKLFSDLLRGGLQSEKIQLAQLEGALSEMQLSFRIHNRFRQLAMLVIARATPMAELQGLQELFQALDVDNSGCLTLDELRKGLKTIDHELSEDEIESLLEFMDVDGSSTIDYHEFVMGILEDKELLTEAKLRAAFDYFDTDGNGKIDIDEVERVVKDLNIKMKDSSPRDLVEYADANEDHAVDFTEFRALMLSAEPNLMINRQQSLAKRSSGLSSSSSGSASQGSFEKALSQPVSLRRDLRLNGADLAARHAALPQEVLRSTAESELREVDKSVNGQTEDAPSTPPETDAHLAAEDCEQRAANGGRSSCDSSEDRLSVLFERRSADLADISNPFSMSAAWPPLDVGARGFSFGGGQRNLSISREGRTMSTSLPNGCSDLREGLGQRSKSISSADGKNGFSRRGRQLVFLGSSGPGLASMKSGDFASIDAIIRRASANDTDSEESDRAELLLAVGDAVRAESPQTLQRVVNSHQLQSPKRIGDIRETIFEHEELATQDLNGTAPCVSGHQRHSSAAASAEVAAMLNFMEDQWSKTSLVAKRKGSSKRG